MENQKIPPSLRELQLWMRWIVTDPRGVREALADPSPSDLLNIERYTSPKKTALPWIVEAPPISKMERLDIYAEAYFARVLESMKSDFQITARVLGEISFQKLVSDYLKKFPSRTSNIGEIGRSFSKFVSLYEDLKHVAFLESLVEVEWLSIELFYAKDSDFIEPSQLTSLTETDWENVEFILAPSVHLVESRWPLDKFWRLQDDAVSLESVDFENPSARKQGFLFCRERGSVSVERQSEPEHMILKKLQAGAGLITALEETQNNFLDHDIESQIMNWFNGWVRRGIISNLKLKT